jgi:hypothetical protein
MLPEWIAPTDSSPLSDGTSRWRTRRSLLAGAAIGATGLTAIYELTGQPGSSSSTGRPGITSWINAVTQYGADNTGKKDAARSINAALAAVPQGGGAVYLPAGTYLVSAPLSITTSGTTLAGAHDGATNLLLPAGAGFGGNSAAVEIANTSGVSISGLSINGAGPSYTSSPTAAGILISNSPRCTVRDCSMSYLNGFAVIVQAAATTPPAQPETFGSVWSYLGNIHATQCAQGIHVSGDSHSGNNAGSVIHSCILEQITAGDALFIENAHDVQVSNLEAWNLSSSSGSCIHIKGDSGAVSVVNLDVGGLTGTTPQRHPAVLIEPGANGSIPRGISISNGIIECGTPGLSVTAGTQVTVAGVQFFRNANYGLQVSGPADILVTGCYFSGSGYTAASRNFDVLISADSGAARIESSEFLTPAGMGSGEVTSAINGNRVTYVSNCRFIGAPAFGDGGGGGSPKLARNNLGYNPVGHVTSPPVPGSGTSLTNPFGQDCLVCVSGGSMSSVDIGGVRTGLKDGAFRLPWGQTITLTYTSAPTWTWFAE